MPESRGAGALGSNEMFMAEGAIARTAAGVSTSLLHGPTSKNALCISKLVDEVESPYDNPTSSISSQTHRVPLSLARGLVCRVHSRSTPIRWRRIGQLEQLELRRN